MVLHFPGSSGNYLSNNPLPLLSEDRQSKGAEGLLFNQYITGHKDMLLEQLPRAMCTGVTSVNENNNSCSVQNACEKGILPKKIKTEKFSHNTARPSYVHSVQFN